MNPMQDDPPAWLRAACAFIETHADHTPPLSAHDVAAAVDVTPRRLLRGFHHYLGFAPADLVRDVLASAEFLGSRQRQRYPHGTDGLGC